MEEDLSRLWGNLSLTEDEEVEVEIKSEALAGIVSRGRSCLVGKLLTERFIGKDIIRSQLIRWWKPTGRLTLKVVGENTFLIDFEHYWDKTRILEGCPWVIEGNVFSVADFDGVTPLEQIDFVKVAFWVRMYKLPLACMGAEVGKQIGSTVGLVEEVDTDEDGIGWGKFLRVKIRLDLTKPLARGRRLKIEGSSVWINFQYERIPRFCFHCGIVLHGRMGCMKKPGTSALGSATEYGPWLRVPPPGRRVHGGAEAMSERKEPDQSMSGNRTGNGIESMAGGGTKTTSGEDSGAYYGTPAAMEEENGTANPTAESHPRGKDPMAKGKDGLYDCINANSGNHDGINYFGQGSVAAWRDLSPFNANSADVTHVPPVTEKGREEWSLNRKTPNLDGESEGRIYDVGAPYSKGKNGVESDVDVGETGSACPGPTLADVEQNMANTSLGEKTGPCKETKTLSWKRRARGVSQASLSSPVEQLGKRKTGDAKGGGAGSGKKGRNLSQAGLAEATKKNEIGSGVAVAGSQPRRPQ
ncbi:uncharacterized protein LOC132181786 [Corylus avellana]|uniref:uncharacterized protein LOC132181786 n=1 Tax=Corylus avellana TaxID=13451 RepID=UPI00286A7AE2|nr:uncharacterized protein LOC132181786 [Corylus avellana]